MARQVEMLHLLEIACFSKTRRHGPQKLADGELHKQGLAELTLGENGVI